MKPVLLLVLLASFTTTFASEHQMEPIIVYSDLDENEEQSVPASLSILGNDEIEKNNATHLADLIEKIPGLNHAGGSSRPRFFQIRGVGERSLYEGVPNHSVGVLVDDIDMSGMGDLGQLFDVEQIEVAKGSQTTRFGSSALAGHINFKTKDPTKELAGDITGSYANYNTRKIQAAIGGPLVDSKKIQYRLAANMNKSDGTIENSNRGRKDTNNIDEQGARMKLRLLPLSKLQVDLTALYTNQENGYDAWTLDNSRTTISDHPGVDTQQLVGGSLKVDYQTLFGRIQFITSGNSSTSNYNYDEDWGNNPYWNNIPGYNADYNYYAENRKEKKNFSQEFRTIGKSWNTGVYLGRYRENALTKSFKDEAERVSRRIDSKYKSQTVAVFGKKEFLISDRLTLVIGARGENKTSNYSNNSNLNANPEDNMFGGDLSLNYFATNDHFLYSSLKRGFKAGGFNTDSTLPDNRRYYDPEYLHTLELGYKGQISKRIRLSNSIFYSNRDDQQIRTSFQDDPNDPNSFTYYVDNAATTNHIGMESALKWLVSDSTTINLEGSLLRAKFKSYKVGAEDRKDRDLAHAPTYQFVAGVNHFFTDTLYVNGSISGKDKFYFSDSHNQQSRPYQLVDLSIGYKKKRFEVTLWSKNIFDKDYAVRGFYFGNEPPAWENKLYTQKGAPRTFGITFKGRL